jgi:hypothetical protein
MMISLGKIERPVQGPGLKQRRLDPLPAPPQRSLGLQDHLLGQTRGQHQLQAQVPRRCIRTYLKKRLGWKL